MKRTHSLIIIFVLVIAPMFPVFMVPTVNADTIASSDVIQEEIVEQSVPDTLPLDDVELTTMFFTETPSSEEGLYFVCKLGMEAIFTMTLMGFRLQNIM